MFLISFSATISHSCNAIISALLWTKQSTILLFLFKLVILLIPRAPCSFAYLIECLKLFSAKMLYVKILSSLIELCEQFTKVASTSSHENLYRNAAISVTSLRSSFLQLSVISFPFCFFSEYWAISWPVKLSIFFSRSQTILSFIL